MRHICIIRQDLPRGVLAAQMIHAAGESGPVPRGTHAVALAAKNEQHLLRIEEALRYANVQHKAIREPDPPWNGALMAIGLHPTEEPPRFLKRLTLIK